MTAGNSTFTPDEARLWAGLARIRDHLAEQWAGLAFRAYPLGVAGLARAGGDPFDNPVGERTRAAARAFSVLLTSPAPKPEEEQALARAVEELIRVRAVQILSPQQALEIFPAMKALLREEAVKIFRQDSGSAENSGQNNGPAIPAAILPVFWALDARIDAVSLAAFDCYCACRERLAQMKLEEQQRRYSQVLRLANKKAGDEEDAGFQAGAKP